MNAPDRRCRVCDAAIAPFMSFGPMPIANRFLKESEFDDEFVFELAPAFCAACATFQLIEQPPAERMFHAAYPFFTGSSRRMVDHFREFAAFVQARLPHAGHPPLVVEIGSNVGTLLAAFEGCRVLGVDPARDVADRARARGINTIDGFFTRQTASAIRERQGAAAAVVAANAVCHVADVGELMTAVASLLAPRGLFVFEDPYLGDLLTSNAYDQIYDEHVFLWSATAVTHLLARHDLELIGVQPQWTHGGSMRYVCSRAGEHSRAPEVDALLDAEQRAGLLDPATFERFRGACEASRDRLRELLIALRRQGHRIAGYAATSKSTTVLNYAGIDRSLIEFIADTTPAKQGRLTPGTHIPVTDPERFARTPPDYAVLFAWNHADEILGRERDYRAGGGRWITYVPQVRVLD